MEDTLKCGVGRQARMRGEVWGGSGADQACLSQLGHHGQGGVLGHSVVPDGAIIMEGHVDLMAAQGASLPGRGIRTRGGGLCAEVPAGHGLLVVCCLVILLVQGRPLGCMGRDGVLKGGGSLHMLQEVMLQQALCCGTPCRVLRTMVQPVCHCLQLCETRLDLLYRKLRMLTPGTVQAKVLHAAGSTLHTNAC